MKPALGIYALVEITFDVTYVIGLVDRRDTLRMRKDIYDQYLCGVRHRYLFSNINRDLWLLRQRSSLLDAMIQFFSKSISDGHLCLL